MIQDIYPHIFDNAFIITEAKPDDTVLVFSDDMLLNDYDLENRAIRYPTYKELINEAKLIYAFSVDNKRYFIDLNDNNAHNYSFTPVREFRSLSLEKNIDLFIVYSAYHLYKWYKNNTYCGRCGKTMIPAEKERALRCPVCDNIVYPRINPAVIIGVTNNDKIILTRYKKGFNQNALVAGFTEFGETLEETVQREVMEEVGLKVKNIRYYKSQPWGIAQDLLAGFFCEVDGDDTIHMDESELKYASWVKREDIILQDSNYSLTNEMMKLFKDNKI